jgi:hypothetical protein
MAAVAAANRRAAEERLLRLIVRRASWSPLASFSWLAAAGLRGQ